MIIRCELRKIFILVGLFLLFLIGLTACQSQTQTPAEISAPATQSGQSVIIDSETIPVTASPTQVEIDSEAGLAGIQAGWQSSPHADTFVLDAAGNNNSCARCHAPNNWMPAMEELPESCFSCKFELEDPHPLIPESEWVNIPCKVCHKVDKKDNVQPEVVWLEIAPIEEYALVSSPTELCLKCHAPTGIPGHGEVDLGGVHTGFECTHCHSAHDTTASCSTAGCHTESTVPIAGHDENHQNVSCVACHDGSGMEVGSDEDTAIWITFVSKQDNSSLERFAFTSHNLAREAKCDRCHYGNNPWGLSEQAAAP